MARKSTTAIAFPSLALTSTNTIVTGWKVHVVAGIGFDDSSPSNIYTAFITVPGPVWAPPRIEGEKSCTFTTIPKDVAGQSNVVTTKGQSQVADDNSAAGPAFIEVVQMPRSSWMLSMAFEIPQEQFTWNVSIETLEGSWTFYATSMKKAIKL